MSSIITLNTAIAAPPERCFQLALSIDFHLASMKKYNEKVVEGIHTGIIDLHESVTWQAKHYFLNWKMTTKISAYVFPTYFISEMTKGPFAKFHHRHIFKENGIHTIMTDIIELSGPCGKLGSLAETLFLKRKITKTLLERNQILRKTAQTDEWKKYITDSSMTTVKAG